MFGTFGAFIRIKSPIRSRQALLEIGAAGPIAGFVVSVAAILIGFALIPSQEFIYEHIKTVHGGLNMESPDSATIQLTMGSSILFVGLSKLFQITIPMDEIYHFPLIFAGWIGFLVTMLNLIPIGQLDGGHMARSLFGKKWHKIATYASMGVLALLGYWFMALFILLLSSRSQDAKPLDDISPLTKNRKKMFVVIAILGVLCAPLPSGILP